MGKLSPKALWVQEKVQLNQAASAEKAIELEDQKYQRLLDDFCEELGNFLGFFEAALADQVREVLNKANLNGNLPVVLAGNDGRRRDCFDFDEALNNCIIICSQRQPVYDIYFAHEPISIAPYVPQIKQDTHDRIDVYKSLDRLYHLAFTQDQNNRPKHRVAALVDAIDAIKTRPIKVDALGQLVGELWRILNPETKGAFLKKHGLYAQPESRANMEKQAKRRNKAKRF